MQVYFFEEGCDEQAQIIAVLQQLRPRFSLSALTEQVLRQQQQGYQLVYVKDGTTVLAVAGFRLAEKLGWGKHIYIDDLVCNQAHRSQGAGAFFIDWVKAYALERDCEQIHLDSGVQRFGAHKFYLRENFTISSHHFALSL